MNKNKTLKYELETLASYTPEDLDYPVFEVGYEDDQGNEGFATTCCIDVAERSLSRIRELEGMLSKKLDLIKCGIAHNHGGNPYENQRYKEVASLLSSD